MKKSQWKIVVCVTVACVGIGGLMLSTAQEGAGDAPAQVQAEEFKFEFLFDGRLAGIEKHCEKRVAEGWTLFDVETYWRGDTTTTQLCFRRPKR